VQVDNQFDLCECNVTRNGINILGTVLSYDAFGRGKKHQCLCGSKKDKDIKRGYVTNLRVKVEDGVNLKFYSLN